MVSVTLTPEQYAAKCAELRAKEGINIVGNAGTIEQPGASGAVMMK